MKQYLLSIYQPDGEPPPPAVLAQVLRDVDALNRERKAASAWVCAAGLRRGPAPPAHGHCGAAPRRRPAHD